MITAVSRKGKENSEIADTIVIGQIVHTFQAKIQFATMCRGGEAEETNQEKDKKTRGNKSK